MILINDIVVVFLVYFVSLSTFYVYHTILLRFVIQESRSVRFNIILTCSFNLHMSNQNLLMSLQLILDLSISSRRSCKDLLFIFCSQSISLHLKCNSEIIFNLNAFFYYFHYMHTSSERIRVSKLRCLQFYCAFSTINR